MAEEKTPREKIKKEVKETLIRMGEFESEFESEFRDDFQDALENYPGLAETIEEEDSRKALVDVIVEDMK